MRTGSPLRDPALARPVHSMVVGETRIGLSFVGEVFNILDVW